MFIFFALLSFARRNPPSINHKHSLELDTNDPDQDETNDFEGIFFATLDAAIFYFELMIEGKNEIKYMWYNLEYDFPHSNITKIKNSFDELFEINYKEFKFNDIFRMYDYTDLVSNISKYTNIIYSKYKLQDIFMEKWKTVVDVTILCKSDILSLSNIFKIDRINLEELLDDIKKNSGEVTLADALKGFSIDPVYIFSAFDFIHELIHDDTKTADTFISSRFDESIRKTFEDLYVNFQQNIVSDSITYHQFLTYIDYISVITGEFESYISGLFAKLKQEFGQFYLNFIMVDEVDNTLKKLNPVLQSIKVKCQQNNINVTYIEKASDIVSDLVNDKFYFNINEYTHINWIGDLIHDIISDIANGKSIWNIMRTGNKYVANVDTNIQGLIDNIIDSLERFTKLIQDDKPIDELIVPLTSMILNITDDESIDALGIIYQSLVLGDTDNDMNITVYGKDINEIVKKFAYVFQSEENYPLTYSFYPWCLAEMVFKGELPLKVLYPFNDMGYYDKHYEIEDSNTLRYFLIDVISVLNSSERIKNYGLNITKVLDMYDEYSKPILDVYREINETLNSLYDGYTIWMAYSSYHNYTDYDYRFSSNNFTVLDLYELFGCQKWIEHEIYFRNFSIERLYNYWYPDKPFDFSTKAYETDYHISSKRISDINTKLQKDLASLVSNITNFTVEKTLEKAMNSNMTQFFNNANSIIQNINLSNIKFEDVASLHLVGDFFGLKDEEITNPDRITTSEWMTMFGIIAGIFVLLAVSSVFIRVYCQKDQKPEEENQDKELEDIKEDKDIEDIKEESQKDVN